VAAPILNHITGNQPPFTGLQLPPQSLKELSLCGHKPRQLQTWLEELPATKLKHISVVFYKLLPEVNQLNGISGSQRLGLLTILRPYVNRCIDGLADEFLKQPLSLDQRATKMAAIAQALQRHLCDGYMISCQQLIETGKSSVSISAELSISLYYAIHGLSQLLFRSYQLFIPHPPLLWKKLHVLYQLALDYQLENNQIQDNLLESRASLSAQQAYYRALLLACSHTNQLRQIDTFHLYRALEQWSTMITLKPARNDDSDIYWIDRKSDCGPFYQKRYTGLPSNSLYSLNLRDLLDLLTSHKATVSDKIIEAIPLHFRQSLLSHLLDVWQAPHERHQARRQTNMELEVYIGLKAAHNQLIQGMLFSTYLNNGEETKSALTMEGDYIAAMANHESDVDSRTHCYVTATDISDQGFCLRWTSAVPPQVKSGEVILLKQPEFDYWQAGTIRWIQRLNGGTYAGIQILAGYAEASAASTWLSDGSTTPFFRTLLLRDPESSSTSSLITPTIPFTAQQSIQLYREGASEPAKLLKLLSGSGTISHYTFKRLQDHP
jgi:hypothetical protein